MQTPSQGLIIGATAPRGSALKSPRMAAMETSSMRGFSSATPIRLLITTTTTINTTTIAKAMLINPPLEFSAIDTEFAKLVKIYDEACEKLGGSHLQRTLLKWADPSSSDGYHTPHVVMAE